MKPALFVCVDVGRGAQTELRSVYGQVKQTEHSLTGQTYGANSVINDRFKHPENHICMLNESLCKCEGCLKKRKEKRNTSKCNSRFNRDDKLFQIINRKVNRRGIVEDFFLCV